MLCQDPVQKPGVVMERKSHVSHKALLLFLPQPAKAVKLLIFSITALGNSMKEIIVKIFRPGLGHLLKKHLIPVLQAVKKP